MFLSRYFKHKSEKGPKKKKGKEITLTVEDERTHGVHTVKVSENLLSEHSLFFRKMSSSGEFKKSRKFKLEGVTLLGFQKSLEYMEAGTATFKDHYEVLETLKVTYKYKIESMKKICIDHMITNLEVHNVCQVYEFATSHRIFDLEYRCLKMIDQKADEVLKSPRFLNLQKATVQELIKRNSLNVSSEVVVFRRILLWGFNECVRQGLDEEKIDEFMSTIRSLLTSVRFLTMSKQELLEPDVDKYYKLLSSDEASSKRKISLSTGSRTRSYTGDSFGLQPRQYLSEYVQQLEVFESDQQPVKNGESFNLRIEVLKGKIFLTSLNLAFEAFGGFKNTACLYVALSATNIMTQEQKTARGTFMNTSDVSAVGFSSPLVTKESEIVEVVLNVKRAENICPLMIKNDFQIVMPESKEIALKITPTDTAEEAVRCIFKEVVYFF